MPVSRLTYTGTCEVFACWILTVQVHGARQAAAWGLGELAAALAERLSISFEKLW